MKYLCLPLLFLLFFQQVKAQDTTHHSKPVFASKEVSSIAAGDMYHYTVEATDSANNDLKFSVTHLPDWLHYEEVTHTISGKTKKAGQYNVQVEVEGKYGKAVQSYMLTVHDKQTQNILCLGNSITNGTSTYNSYRRALWQLLHGDNYNFDLIGSWSKHHMGGDVPNPDFDLDHDGHSGWTAQDIFTPPSWDSVRGNINTWLQSYTPDIVLIELGTNDVFQCRKPADVMNDFMRMITLLRSKKTGVKIFIAQIPPMGAQWATKKLCGTPNTYGEDIMAFNKAVASFAKDATTDQSPVIVVDQHTGVNPATDMYDDIHPNAEGEKEMAARWFNAIKRYLNKL